MNIVNQNDWSLFRKGEADQERHQQKIDKILKSKIKDIIAEESIIMSDGKKKIKVPIRGVQQYHFKFNFDNSPRAGTGKGDSKKGDVIYRGSKQNGGGKGGKRGGTEEGEEMYEVEVSLDRLQKILFDDLGLPYLDNTKRPEFSVEKIIFNDVRKKGLISNIDKRRTIKNAIRRNAINGVRGLSPMKPEDLRFKTWNKKIVPKSNAVIFAMMDVSGSMGTFEKYISRSFFFWMARFLRTKYTNIEIVFIAHDTRAKVVNEEQFFSRVESGGTICSSAYELALELIEKHYPVEDYNLYAFHFSDGGNWGEDNSDALAAMKKLSSVCNAVGYGEIRYPEDRSTDYNGTLIKCFREDHDLAKRVNFTSLVITSKSHVYFALKQFFRSSWTIGVEDKKAVLDSNDSGKASGV